MTHQNTDTFENLKLMIQAEYPAIYIQSYEWERVNGDLKRISKLTGRTYLQWNRNIDPDKEDQLQKAEGSVWETHSDCDVRELLRLLEEEISNSIILIEDFHNPYLQDHNADLIHQIRKICRAGKGNSLIFLSPVLKLPAELEKEVTVLEYPLPKAPELEKSLKSVCEEKGIEIPKKERESLIQAALGLTIMEADLAFSKAYEKNRKLGKAEVPLVMKEKEQLIKKSGQLEYYDPEVDLDSVGGLENLKEWLGKRRKAFSMEAYDYGLEKPKGTLLVGVQGCGKSLTAKAVASAWEFPLLRLDVGKLFGSLVGESESNIRRALSVAEAMSPCVLWIDEIEKALSGAGGAGSTDSGTSTRVFGTFLTWMQEKKEPVFIVATANNISSLPPEFMRKGRFDELFFVDLPTKREREKIFTIHLTKKPEKAFKNVEIFDMPKLVEKSEGFSGAEIEEAINEAMFTAFNENRSLQTTDLLGALKETVPLSKTRKEDISELRKWGQDYARMASQPEEEEVTKQRNISRFD